MYSIQLETFLRAAEMGSFSRAADKLYISPNAVLKQINVLEERLGVTLFNRTHRGIELTEAGKLLYREASYIIDYCDRAVEQAREVMSGEVIAFDFNRAQGEHKDLISV